MLFCGNFMQYYCNYDVFIIYNKKPLNPPLLSLKPPEILPIDTQKSGAPVCPERRFDNTNYIFEPLEPFEPPRAPDERIFVSNE